MSVCISVHVALYCFPLTQVFSFLLILHFIFLFNSQLPWSSKLLYCPLTQISDLVFRWIFMRFPNLLPFHDHSNVGCNLSFSLRFLPFSLWSMSQLYMFCELFYKSVWQINNFYCILLILIVEPVMWRGQSTGSICILSLLWIHFLFMWSANILP